jgi:hypothetical protein
MNIDVIKNLLNGLIINNSIKKIDIDEQVHTLLVVSVKAFKLKFSFEIIYIINYIKIIYNNNLMNYKFL